MTEEDARKKWCPFVRAMDYKAQTEGVNRISGHREDRLSGNSHCIASECMAWRISAATVVTQKPSVIASELFKHLGLHYFSSSKNKAGERVWRSTAPNYGDLPDPPWLKDRDAAEKRIVAAFADRGMSVTVNVARGSQYQSSVAVILKASTIMSDCARGYCGLAAKP